MKLTSGRSLRVATRGSALALWQAHWIMARIEAPIEELILKTSGEARMDVPIHELGGQGAFVTEVQNAVLDGRADFAVHSAKDLPAQTPKGLVIACVPERGEVRDAIVGCVLADLPEGGTVGTGSVRRRAQLSSIRPDLKFENLRGNVDTRLNQVSKFDAIVLACAGIDRLGRSKEISEIIPTEVMLPQIGQGALAVECRADDEELITAFKELEDKKSRLAVDAERAFLGELGGSCDFPEGALAHVDNGGVISLRAMLASLDGKIMLRHEAIGEDPHMLGKAVARFLLDDAGGQSLVTDLRASQ